jgi:hypothetical protein
MFDRDGDNNPVTPTQPGLQLPVVIKFEAESATVKVNTCTTLRWETLYAVTANITPNIGNVGPAGSRQVCFSTTGLNQYTLTLTGSDGRQPPPSFASVLVTP